MDLPTQSAHFTRKIITNYGVLKRVTNGLRAANRKVVVTIGSWDMLHIGHLRYLARAKSFGDVLIVGADSDRAIRRYKGPHRPVIPETERMEMLSYQAFVDYVTIIDDVTIQGLWQYGLLRALHPDIFIAVKDSYPRSQRQAIAKLVGTLKVLPRQAEHTSSTDVFQRLIHELPHLISILDRR
ncbi:MAG: adenylyltransferase/cytidyltransferase family protein [Patescibacteria group bacterium]